MPDLNSTFLGVELQNWVTSGAIVLLVGIAHLALGWLTRRRARTNWDALAPGKSAQARYWVARGLSDAVPPIAFMLWVHGLYFAVTTLLADLPETTWVSQGFMTLGELRGVGMLLGLAWLLATAPDDKVRDGKRAVELAKTACELTEHKNGGYLDTLAAAYAEAGDFKNAVEWQEKAIKAGDMPIKDMDAAKKRLELFKNKKPYRGDE